MSKRLSCMYVQKVRVHVIAQLKGVRSCKRMQCWLVERFVSLSFTLAVCHYQSL